MKKYLVIGNPIEHSMSPRLHNFWLKENNINAIYDKKQIEESGLAEIIAEVKKENISGINVTIPYKKKIITFLDKLSPVAEKLKSVNTVYKKNNKIYGDNTDAGGFELALKHIKYNVENKKVFIIGAGGVVSSIIFTLKKMGAAEIFLSNRSKEKVIELKKIYSDLKIVDWGNFVDFDMIINATSLGLKKTDKIEIDLSKVGSGKMFFDVIYNPPKTNFLTRGEGLGNKIENGKMMFIYQAQLSFEIWNNILPKVNDRLLD